MSAASPAIHGVRDPAPAPGDRAARVGQRERTPSPSAAGNLQMQRMFAPTSFAPASFESPVQAKCASCAAEEARPGDEPVGELTVPQYLGRLAANATTIINAEDYGRTIYDLAAPLYGYDPRGEDFLRLRADLGQLFGLETTA